MTDAPSVVGPDAHAHSHAARSLYFPEVAVAPVAKREPLSDAAIALLSSLGSRDFDLLSRTVELVVQSQAYSSARLAVALRVEAAMAAQLTGALVVLGVIADGEPDDPRLVLIDVSNLAGLLGDIRALRRDAVGSGARIGVASIARPGMARVA